MSNAIDPHHRVVLNAAQITTTTKSDKDEMFYLFVSSFATLLCALSAVRRTHKDEKNCENRIQSPLSDGNVLILLTRERRGEWMKPPLMRFRRERKIPFILFPAAQINLEVDDCLWIINHDIILLLWWADSSFSQSLLFLIYTAFVRDKRH